MFTARNKCAAWPRLLPSGMTWRECRIVGMSDFMFRFGVLECKIKGWRHLGAKHWIYNIFLRVIRFAMMPTMQFR